MRQIWTQHAKKPLPGKNSSQYRSDWGVRRFVPDKFVFGDLDYKFVVGVWGFAVGVLGFWAWDKFWGRIVTDSQIVDYTVELSLQGQRGDNSQKANSTFQPFGQAIEP